MEGTDWLHESRPSIPSQRNIKEPRFRDLNVDYSQDALPVELVEEQAIKSRIRFVLSSLLGAEDFLPGFASNLPLRLYEPICTNSAYLLELDTFIALSDWMQDAIIVGANIICTPLELEDGYKIDIPYRIISTGNNVVYSFEVLR